MAAKAALALGGRRPWWKSSLCNRLTLGRLLHCLSLKVITSRELRLRLPQRSIERGHVERPVNTEETQHGRLLMTTTPATLPDAKPLCGGTAKSGPCVPCLPAMLREQSRDGADTLGSPLPKLARGGPPSFQGTGPGFELRCPSKAHILSVQTRQHRP